MSRALKEMRAEAAAIIEQAKADHDPVRTFVMFSGGNDSLVLLDAVAAHADEVVHINTGIGVPETTDFARRVGSSYGLPFSEWSPPVAYEELVLTLPVLDGLPGPGVHHIVYSRLKERCVEALLRSHRTRRGQRFMLLTGIRQAESRKRMGYRDPVNRRKGQVWVNPLLFWANEEMANYRRRRKLPVNEVAANLHMSGECLCGAMADQGPEREERALIRFFYPAVDARLTALEETCRAAGKTYCEWGVKRSRQRPPPAEAEPLCVSCEFRNSEEEAP